MPKKMQRPRGQGSTEYLIILGMILFLALLGAMVLGFFPESTGDVSTIESQIYWRGQANPIRILSESAGDGDFCGLGVSEGFSLTLENSEWEAITLTKIMIDGGEYSFCEPSGGVVDSVTLPSFSSKRVLVYSPSTINCVDGRTLGLDVAFTYTSDFPNQLQEGVNKLYVKCSSLVNTAELNQTTLSITTSSLPDGTCDTGYMLSEEDKGEVASFSDWKAADNEISLSFSPILMMAGPGGYQLEARWADGSLADAIWTANGLPTGMSVSSSGLLSGSPCEGGDFTPTFYATCEGYAAHRSIPLYIDNTWGCSCGTSPVRITTVSLPDATEDIYYLATLSATGGDGSYEWSVSGLPIGVSYSSSTGEIYGTPAIGSAGDYSVSVTVLSDGDSDSEVFPLTVISNVLDITTPSLPDADVGEYYETTLTATGGTGSYNWSATGVPAGLDCDSSGMIYGVPEDGSDGDHSVTVYVSSGSQADSQAYTLTVIAPIPPPSPLQITTASVPNGYRYWDYSTTISATGGTPPYTWSESGIVSDLSIDTSSGEISGQPQIAEDDWPFTIYVTDSAGTPQSDSQEYTMSIRLSVSMDTMPDIGWCYVDEPCEKYIAARYGFPDFTWDYLGGYSGGGYDCEWSTISGLPPGLDFGEAYNGDYGTYGGGITGYISGTPTTVGKYGFRAEVTDNNGDSPNTFTSSHYCLEIIER